MTLTDIAICFSTGQFSRIQQHFSETITWEIVGEQRLSGFETGHHVIVQGEAQFHDAKQTSRISACDVYTFNNLNQLAQIQSYCISIQ